MLPIKVIKLYDSNDITYLTSTDVRNPNNFTVQSLIISGHFLKRQIFASKYSDGQTSSMDLSNLSKSLINFKKLKLLISSTTVDLLIVSGNEPEK